MKLNNHIINNDYPGGQKKCLKNLLLFPLITLLILLLFTSSNYGEASEINLIENSYGENKPLAPRILVAYATRAGSTAEVADAIGKKLAAGGAMVDVKPVEKVQSINGYQSVVLGSAIRFGNLLPEMTDFVHTHKDELHKVPAAYFIVCFILRENTEENRKTANAYLDPLRAEVIPVNVGLFAGKMDYSKLSSWETFIIKYIVKAPEGDLRDWKQINDWAANLLPKLQNINKVK
jgi:menaquinone-dependent protoporphyrinogen oxidase